MGDVPLARQLPLPHELLAPGLLEHYGAAPLVQHRPDALGEKQRVQVVRVLQAPLHVLPEALVALHRQRVPHVDRGVAVPAAHDGSVPAVQVLDVVRQRVNVPRSGDHQPTRGRAAHELVSADADRADWLLEGYQGGLLDERDHHAEKRPVAVDVEPVLRVPDLPQNFDNLVQIIDGALHRGADVHVHDRGPRLVLLQKPPQVVAVHLARHQRPHFLAVHPVHRRGLEDGVVGLIRRVQNSVRQVFPAHQDAVEVTLRAAVRDVAPIVLLVDLPQLGEPVQHAELELP
mmetsp:Transcript_9666/g.33332  ORF Transcript_9666/g.33332 Transcript_9666/m.33332 type:complete len:288 (+) Transcript_9666:714-1577(+)